MDSGIDELLKELSKNDKLRDFLSALDEESIKNSIVGDFGLSRE